MRIGQLLAIMGTSLLLFGCSVQRAVVAQSAQDKMLGFSKEQVLACMGPPRDRMTAGATEVWSYGSGNGRVTTVGSSTTHTDGKITGERTPTGLSGSGEFTSRSFGSQITTARSCTVNVTMNDGSVSRVNFVGATGGILTRGEQCAFAVENCAR